MCLLENMILNLGINEKFCTDFGNFQLKKKQSGIYNSCMSIPL